jgi:hypothetical protein
LVGRGLAFRRRSCPWGEGLCVAGRVCVRGRFKTTNRVSTRQKRERHLCKRKRRAVPRATDTYTALRQARW